MINTSLRTEYKIQTTGKLLEIRYFGGEYNINLYSKYIIAYYFKPTIL